MRELGLDPETALRLINLLFAGWLLLCGICDAGSLPLCCLPVQGDICRTILPEEANRRSSRASQSCSRGGTEPHVIPAKTLALVEEAAAAGGEAVIDWR